jgi:hypothetical protein
MDDPAEDRLHGAMHPPHRRGELLFAVASFAVAVFLATQWWSETTRVDGIDWRRQPGLWPAVAIAGMLVFGAGELAASVLRARRQGVAGVGAEVLSWGRAIEFIVWFMAYVWLVPVAGYLPATVAFAVLLTWRLGYRGGWLLAAAATGVGVVVLFKGLLAVRIPGGAVYEVFPPTIRNFLVLYL